VLQEISNTLIDVPWFRNTCHPPNASVRIEPLNLA
jgi:hypothetical protein